MLSRSMMISKVPWLFSLWNSYEQKKIKIWSKYVQITSKSKRTLGWAISEGDDEHSTEVILTPFNTLGPEKTSPQWRSSKTEADAILRSEPMSRRQLHFWGWQEESWIGQALYWHHRYSWCTLLLSGPLSFTKFTTSISLFSLHFGCWDDHDKCRNTLILKAGRSAAVSPLQSNFSFLVTFMESELAFLRWLLVSLSISLSLQCNGKALLSTRGP